MGYFDEILAKVSSEDRAVLDKYPELKSSMNDLENKLGEVSRYAGSWIDWQNKNWNPELGMTNAEAELRTRLADAEARATAAGTRGTGGVDDQAIASLKRDLADTQTKLANNEKTLGGINIFYDSIYRHAFAHKDEFGESLDNRQLLKYMQDNGINDPDVAYDKWVAPRRAEIATKRSQEADARHQEELKAAEQRGYEKRAQEAAMGPGGMLPTDSSGGITGISARLDNAPKISDEVKARIQEARPGDGSLAQLGYELFRKGELPIQ